MPIALTLEHGPHPGIAKVEVARRIKAMIHLLQLEKMDVSFVLTDDETIHQLNKVYRGKDRPTDVLAFAMREGEFADLAGSVLGDVIVSVPTARKQALSRRANVLDEVTMLLAHGLLHLLGWDHDTPAKDRRMKAETARLCAAAAPSRPSRTPSKDGAKKLLSQNRSVAKPHGRRRKARG